MPGWGSAAMKFCVLWTGLRFEQMSKDTLCLRDLELPGKLHQSLKG